MIGGDAGVGKTRLVGELIDAARADGFSVLLGQCVYLGGETMPYAPVIDILRELAIVRRASGRPVIAPTESELLRLAPILDPDLPVPEVSPNPTRLFEQMLALLRRLAEEQPTLIIVEDVHWADGSTRALLAFLLQHLRASRAMVVGTYRSDELTRRDPLWRWLSELERGIHPERLELRPFDRPELRKLLEALAGSAVAPDVVQRIHARSGGNAFFAEHLFASTHGGDVRTLEEAVRARLTDLSDDSYSVLSLAAAFRRLDPAMLTVISKRSADQVDQALRELVDVGLLVMVDDELRFSHELVREVLDASLLPGRRVQIHQQIAQALEDADQFTAAAGELAYHWSAAGVLAKALPAAVGAIDEAMQLSAIEEACAQCEKALELWEQVDQPEQAAGVTRRQLLFSYADAAYLQGKPQKAIALLREELGRIEPGDPALPALYERLVRCARAAQDADALAVAERAADHIGEYAEPAVRAQLFKVTANAALVTGRLKFVEETTEKGLRAAREAGDRIAELAISIIRGYVLGIQGHFEGIEALARLVSEAQKTSERDAWYRALTSYAFCMCVAGRPEETIVLCDQGIQEFGQSASLRAEFRTYRMGALRWLGRWDELVDDADRLAFDLELLGWTDLEGAALAPVLVERGDFDRALPMVEAAWEKILRTSLHALAVPSTAAAAAMTAIYTGHPENAHGYLISTLDSIAGQWPLRVPELVAVGVRAAADHAVRARAARDERTESKALDQIGRLFVYLPPALADERIDMAHCQATMGAWSTQAQAERDRAAGHSDPADWTSLASDWPGLHRPEQAAYCHYRAAAVQLTRPSDHNAGRASLLAARRMATELGAVPLLRQIEALAVQRLLVVNEDQVTAAAELTALQHFGLTTREAEVLALIAEHRTNKEIAVDLHISAKTVDRHLGNIFGKLQVNNRGEAAQVYRRLTAGHPPPSTH
jgi:DNA-binding CsgD family transcriptional regulator